MGWVGSLSFGSGSGPHFAPILGGCGSDTREKADKTRTNAKGCKGEGPEA
jgi:hypothetical protein